MKQLKLTNRQLDLVVDMIFDKIKLSQSDNAVKQQKAIEGFKSQAKKSKLYANFKKMFGMMKVKYIEISDETIREEFPKYKGDLTYISSTSIYKPEDIITKVAEGLKHTIKSGNETTRRDIEKQVMMQMVGITDIQSLIDAVTKSFTNK